MYSVKNEGQYDDRRDVSILNVRIVFISPVFVSRFCSFSLQKADKIYYDY